MQDLTKTDFKNIKMVNEDNYLLNLYRHTITADDVFFYYFLVFNDDF